MAVPEALRLLVQDYTLRTVALGSSVLGITSGALGAFAVLRKQSLLGDAISHAALPGIAIAFLITGSKAPLVIIAGAAAAGWIGTLLFMSIVKQTRIKSDSALGIILSVFFGFGLVLLTFIQKRPDANQAGLDKFLFGQAATLIVRDVVAMASLGAVSLLLVFLLWKEFKILSFDAEYGKSQGFPIRFLDITLTTLLVIAIVIGLQTVGVVLMSALVVAPAASSRQWTDKLGVMVILSALFGAAAGVIGSVLSSMTARLPTGPTIVICLAAIAFFSILGAPKRGLLWRWYRDYQNRNRLQVSAVLSDLYILARQHGGIDHAHPIEVLHTMSLGHGGVDRTLRDLERRGWVKQLPDRCWQLTEEGLAQARKEEAVL
jgi:manganese/zinc/iron transport system permease protein